MRKSAWWAIAALAAGAAWALDPPRPVPPPAPPPAGQQEAPAAAEAAGDTAGETATAVPADTPGAIPGPAPDPAPSPEPAEDETLPPLPPEARKTGPTPQRFDPSEEVRADFPISFPVDI